MLKIGCCGWSYFRREKGEGSVLSCYARRYSLVEVNSTFYCLPKTSTAERWRVETDAINENFEFTVKVHRDITHMMKFGDEAIPVFDKTKEIAERLIGQRFFFFRRRGVSDRRTKT